MFVLFFKQKTAYEMRISDWSSDVCSSDLTVQIAAVGDHPRLVDRHPARHPPVEPIEQHARIIGEPVGAVAVEPAAAIAERGGQIPVIERGERDRKSTRLNSRH